MDSQTDFLELAVIIHINFHLHGYDDWKKADIICEIMSSREQFDLSSATNAVAIRVTRSVTSTVFSSVALLWSTDSNAGALNHKEAEQYAKIKYSSPLLETQKGKGMLNKH